MNVLIVPRDGYLADALIDQVRAVAPHLNVTVTNAKSLDELGSALAESEVMLTSLGMPSASQAPRMRWVQAFSAGVDSWLRKPDALRPDVALTTASGVHAPVMAEYSLSMMLAWAHEMPLLAAHQAQHQWASHLSPAIVPAELRGATVGILGYGSIGRETARLAHAFGMRVLACKRNPHQRSDTGWTIPDTGDPEGTLPAHYYPIEQLHTMLAECDYVVLTLALTPATRHIIDSAALHSLKPGAVLVNVARGGLVDEPALIETLRSGLVRAASLDVFEQEPLPSDSPLWDMPNVLITPHIAGNHPAHDQRLISLFTDNLRRYLAGQPLLNQVDPAAGY